MIQTPVRTLQVSRKKGDYTRGVYGSQLEDCALLGQSTWSFIALLLLSRLGDLLPRGGLFCFRCCSRTGSRCRDLGLRLATTMQSLVGLSNGLIEGLALSLGNRELKSSRLTGTVGSLR